MSQLPIDAVIPELISHLSNHSQLILKAPPGAGKSTRLPLVLLQQAVVTGKIVMLEPRRLAARNIANYLAAQLGEEVGQSVGLRMRGETKVSNATKLEIVTEGVMTRMLQQDPELDGISLLIFDEFHERSLHADTSLALALEVQEALRDDLQILVMSATLDEQALTSLLPQASYTESQGRCFPVSYQYQAVPDDRDWLAGIERAIRQLLSQESGSMLVFLPGAGEIKRLAEQLSEGMADNVLVCPLYGQLNGKQQQQAIAPAPQGQRKVVLATNIAETSLTIEGVRLVVDCGYERVAQWDPKTGISRLEKVRIAQSSAEQRAGRAGRLEAGLCLRLYSEEQLTRQPATPKPEILRADLTSLAMELAQWGCQQADDLQWLDLPPAIALRQSQALLQQLGVLDSRLQFTEFGQTVQSFGAEPRHAAILAFALQHDNSAQVTAAMLVALLEEPPRGANNPDLHFQLSLLESGKLARATQYLQRAQQHFNKMTPGSVSQWRVSREWLAPLLAAGFPDRIALSRSGDGRYQLANGQGAMLPADEPLADSELLVVVDVVKTRQGDSRIFSAAAADSDHLQQYLPRLFCEREWLDWDDNKGRLTAEKHWCCGKLILKRQSVGEPDPAKASQALVNAIRRKGLGVLNWSAKAESLLVRARCAGEWLPELALPALDEASLLAQAEEWLLPFMNGMTSLKALAKLDVAQALEAYLGWDKTQVLEAALPTHYQVPTGSRYPIRYQVGQQPVLAVKLQEMFGEQRSPMIANGKVGLVLELLSPAQRPLQITQDLAAFWQGSYHDVKKEMKGRYPKHPWPDDPANHEPTRKTKRQLQ
ncbi:ATP-dependent helicase [Photobacterium jeanii]|uniref:ATP-dependent helicase n=1 Tax=Photobacterium jeanii TaxID=858640 RepID=A0A178KH73_9GAMM|nr:ATP-dependent helicase HrpB [Photobacterium jeanii]OAN16617.1 ATP-dependent helicase [Photobacterium jeanii]PST88010.1 ATP-dependent helicase HrpB [Photobacterium jeanii]